MNTMIATILFATIATITAVPVESFSNQTLAVLQTRQMPDEPVNLNLQRFCVCLFNEEREMDMNAKVLLEDIHLVMRGIKAASEATDRDEKERLFKTFMTNDKKFGRHLLVAYCRGLLPDLSFAEKMIDLATAS